MTNMFAPEDLSIPDVTAIQAKYENDPNKAWQALAHSQAHIAKLEAEAKERARALTLEQALEQIKNTTQSAVTPPSQETTISPAPGVLDDTTLEHKLNEWSRRKAEQDRLESARTEVRSTLLRTFGTAEKASAEMALKAKELNMSVEALDAIALNSPQAFYKLFGIENTQRPVNVAPTMGNIRTNMTDQRPVDPTAEFREILKKDRNKAMSQEVQTAIMQKAYKAAGLI